MRLPPCVLPAALLLWTAGCGGAPDARTNVLLISIDTLRADHLQAYGYARATSPHIDRLAAGGVLFETAVAETSWTLPAHMTLFTGLPSRVHQVTFDGVRLGGARRTLAQAFREAGYRTRGFASAPYLHPIFGFDRGFETYRVLGETVYDADGFELGATVRDADWFARKVRDGESFRRRRSSPELAEAAVAALEELRAEPFFLFVHWFDPHAAYDPPERYWRRFDPDYAGGFDPHDPDRVHAGMPPRELDHLIARYDGEILFTDEHVGHVLLALERLGLAERTLVVLTSDHGEEFLDHGGREHRWSLYDEQLLVPLVLRLPSRLPAGVRVSTQVRAMDVAPTILEIADLPPEPQMLGSSLLPLTRAADAATASDRPAASYLVDPKRSVARSLRAPPWKLIEIRRAGEPRPRRRLFFDLRRDPGETRELPDSDSRRKAERRLSRLVEEADAWRARLPGDEPAALALPPDLRRALESLGYVEQAPGPGYSR